MNLARMYDNNPYKNLRVSSGFSIDRGSYIHGGIDIPGNKKNDVENIISGITWEIGEKKETWGKYVIVKSNLKFCGGVNETLFTEYDHLDKIFVNKNDFVDYNSILGKMGNSGNSWTFDNNSWRKITEEEKTTTELGVHLHLWFHQDNLKAGNKTKLYNDLKKYRILGDNTAGITHIWQWGKLLYAPRVITSYMETLNKKYNL